MDGTPTLRMNEFMLATIATGKADLGPPRSETTGSSLPEPTEVKFALNTEVEYLIKGAEERFDALVGAHDLHVNDYQERVFRCLTHGYPRCSTTRDMARTT
jgi:carnitine O-acetyltransferase